MQSNKHMNPFDKEAYYYNIFHKDKDYRKEAQEIRNSFPKAKTVLEVGCGTGLLSVELEKLSFKVTGIDTSEQMLKYYKGKTKILADIRTFKPKTKFDLLLAHYDVFNYLSMDEVLVVVARRKKLAKDISIEMWKGGKVTPFTYKKVDGCRRVRLGFRFGYKVHLWYFFWGKGLVVSKHTLYL